MSAQIRFFATANDLVPVLESIEIENKIKYVKLGRNETPAVESFLTVTALPNLGRASNESSINCDSFLICRQNESIRARQVVGHAFVIDQLLNPETVAFSPGGLWGSDTLLHGRFATASETMFSAALLKLIGSKFRKRFKKIKAFYVGNEAEQMLDGGRRLTIAAQSPRELDLSRK